MGLSTTLSESSESSSLAKMQQQYWTTKQAVFKKLGKKEDDCITASDLELDLKLELYQTIEESFLTLMRVLESYQEKLCVLAQEENALGRFLKENGKQDKTRAGKVMSSAGKALSYSAQQRLTLRIPLVRLYQEVETFQYRAIVDTLQTVEKMEKARTAYRGSLMWMKDVSQQLDPDTCKQMEKFRKVQSQVRKAKQKFDKMKLDTLQKVDLLSFSRCNLFSQALAAYQNALLNVSQKIAHSSNSVAAATKGYQHYEFYMLKELTETSKKLAEGSTDLKPLSDGDKDTILFFEDEYHDEIDNSNPIELHAENRTSQAVPNHNTPSMLNFPQRKFDFRSTDNETNEDTGLLNLIESSGEGYADDMQHLLNVSETQSNLSLKSADDPNCVTDELLFLNDFVETPTGDTSAADENFHSNWQAVFGTPSQDAVKTSVTNEPSDVHKLPSFLPSQLLDINCDLNLTQTNAKGLLGMSSNSECPLSSSVKESNLHSGDKKGKSDMSAWFNLFADLDPLANPDLVGDRKGNYDDRNC